MEKSAWRKASTKRHSSRPSVPSKQNSRDGVKETETSSGLESDKEVPRRKGTSASHKSSIKLEDILSSIGKRKESRSSSRKSKTLSDLENGKGLPENITSSVWRKTRIKSRGSRPSIWKKKESKDNTKEIETPSVLETDKEVPRKIGSAWRIARIKLAVARPSTWKKKMLTEDIKETEIPFGLENDKEVRKKIMSSAWRRARIKLAVTRPSTWKKVSEQSTKETETPADLETGKEVPSKIEDGWRKANIKMQMVKPTTWKRKDSSYKDDKEDKTFELENGKMEETDWQKANVKMRITQKTKDSGDGTKETKSPRRMTRSGWRKTKMTMAGSRSTTWKRKESRETEKDSEISPALEFSREIHEKVVGDKNWRHSSIWVARPSIWKSPEEIVKAQQIFNLKDKSDALKRDRKSRKRWRKATIAMRVIRRSKDRTLLEEGDEGPSKFVLANCEHYSNHPNLIQYYEPIKVTEPYKSFIRKQKIKRFMSRVAEFDQNKTLLIMTNNPPPSPINWEGKDNIPCYFSQELLAQPQKEPKTTSHTGLPLMKKKLKAEPKTPFPVILLEDSKPKQKQWYRFSTKADFKSEAKFSKLHALKKQEEEYPELSFVPDFRSDREKARRRKVSIATWEPLTLDALQQEKPVLMLPLQGDSPFRYGKVPQWLVSKTSVAD